jgi:DNA-binding CsgD family transcriptional regulator
MNGSWEESYRSMAKSISHQNKVIRKSLQQPVLTAQNNFLNQELELQKYKAQSERQMRIIGVVLTILLVVAAVYGVSVYIKRQREKYLKQIRKQVARIELLKDEKNGMEEEVRKLNLLLSQGGELKDELMQAKGEWTRLEDIRALELYTRLHQAPSLYNPSADYDALLRWVDIASVRFAERLQESYPHLNVSEITLCCLVRMGYSPSQMAEILHVKIPTVNRYIYRICTSLELPNHKESFRQFIVAF